MKNMDEALKILNPINKNISLSRYQDSLLKCPYSTNDMTEGVITSLKSCNAALDCLSTLFKYDKYTFSHCINVCLLSIVLGCALDLNQKQLIELGVTAILHDVGKTFIPKKILNKRAQLTSDDFALIKTHAAKGYHFVKENIDIPGVSFFGVLHHHEKYDGSGYPLGLKGDHIDLFGRIISLADVYDAITSDRPYRKAQHHSDAIHFICYNSGICFDPQIVSIFKFIMDNWIE